MGNGVGVKAMGSKHPVMGGSGPEKNDLVTVPAAPEESYCMRERTGPSLLHIVVGKDSTKTGQADKVLHHLSTAVAPLT